MLYDTPGQEDEDSALRFRKITKDEYDDVLRLVDRLWEQKKQDSSSSKQPSLSSAMGQEREV